MAETVGFAPRRYSTNQLVQTCQAHSSFAVNVFVTTFRSRLLSRRGNKRNTVAFGGKLSKILPRKFAATCPFSSLFNSQYKTDTTNVVSVLYGGDGGIRSAALLN